MQKIQNVLIFIGQFQRVSIKCILICLLSSEGVLLQKVHGLGLGMLYDIPHG